MHPCERRGLLCSSPCWKLRGCPSLSSQRHINYVCLKLFHLLSYTMTVFIFTSASPDLQNTHLSTILLAFLHFQSFVAAVSCSQMHFCPFYWVNQKSSDGLPINWCSKFPCPSFQIFVEPVLNRLHAIISVERWMRLWLFWGSHISSILKTEPEYKTPYLGLWFLKFWFEILRIVWPYL